MKRHRQEDLALYRMTRNLQKKEQKEIGLLKAVRTDRRLGGNKVRECEVLLSSALFHFRGMDYEET